MALTIEDLYQNVLGRDPDPVGLKHYTEKFGSTIDPNEITTFVNAAQAERPGAAYKTPLLTGLPANYPVYGPSGPVQTPISNVPVVTPPPRPPLVVTPVPLNLTSDEGFQRAMIRPTYKKTQFASRQGPAPTLEQLYQNVLGRKGDEKGLAFYRNLFGSTIDPNEIAAFVAAAQAERPGAFYAGPNVPPRPVSYADTALLKQNLSPTGISTLVQAPTVFSGTPTDPRTSKPFTIADRPAANVAPVVGKKAGGLASLADKVQSAGRNGDTMLAHITPEEAGILTLMGGSGTINPRTGLPEFFNPLREIRNLGRSIEKNVRQAGRSIDRRITQPIIGGLNSLAERLGPIGQLAAMYFGGPIGAGIYAGFAAPGSDFNVKRAAQAAALTYAGSNLMGGTPTGGANPMSAADYGASIDALDAYNAAGAATPSMTPIPGPSAMISLDPNVISYTPNPASYVGGAPAMGQTAMIDNPVVTDAAGSAGSITNQLTAADKAYEATRPFMDRTGDYLSNLGSKALDYAVEKPFPAALYATMGTSLIQGQREREEFKEEEKRKADDLEERRRRYREQAERIMSQYPIRFAARGGMLDDIDDPRDEVGYGMAGGGMPPRFLSGGGDGMSDSIPAVIANKQPARLADGEFVIPADVVSHLGNGSSKAGAKQLYAMMDRIRKARTGTTKQGREVKPRRYMPA